MPSYQVTMNVINCPLTADGLNSVLEHSLSFRLSTDHTHHNCECKIEVLDITGLGEQKIVKVGGTRCRAIDQGEGIWHFQPIKKDGTRNKRWNGWTGWWPDNAKELK